MCRGSGILIGVPGFSFFRAPARWSLATSLALAILAGKGFDRWREWPRPGRSLRRLAIVAALWILAVIGLLELAVWSTAKPGRPAVAAWFDRAFKAMPWHGDPSFGKPDPSFAEVMAGAGSPRAILTCPPSCPGRSCSRSRWTTGASWISAGGSTSASCGRRPSGSS